MSDLIVHDAREWYYTMVDNPVIDDEELSKNALVVYVALCKFANVHTKECFPTYEKLCKTARMSNTPLSNALTELEQKGYIKRKRRPNKSVLYQIIGSLETREPKPSGSLENGIPETREELEPVLITNKKKDIYIGISEIIAAWNKIGIVQHSETDNMKQAVMKALKKHTKEQIIAGINNYATVLRDDSFKYAWEWRLDKFLTRKDKGLVDFLDDGQIWLNYLKHIDKSKSKPMFTNIQM